jgi:hypothetical protein
MSKYIVTAEVTISVSTVVEAESEAEALAKAAERGVHGAEASYFGDHRDAFVYPMSTNAEPFNLRAKVDRG